MTKHSWGWNRKLVLHLQMAGNPILGQTKVDVSLSLRRQPEKTLDCLRSREKSRSIWKTIYKWWIARCHCWLPEGDGSFGQFDLFVAWDPITKDIPVIVYQIHKFVLILGRTWLASWFFAALLSVFGNQNAHLWLTDFDMFSFPLLSTAMTETNVVQL